jgi:hypothetical protein
MIKIIFKNLLFYRRKTALTAALLSFLFFLDFASFLFTDRIKKAADAPLGSLQTEIILQQDQVDKKAAEIKTQGIIEPFNLAAFSKKDALKKLSRFKEIKAISTALVLWQFDIQNNRTIVGLDVGEPVVGLRHIEKLLTPQSQFLSGNSADEVILERHFAKLFGYKLNGNYRIGNKNYQIVGIVDFKEESNLANAEIFMPYDKALALLGKDEPIVNQAYLSLADASLLPRVQKEIENDFPQFSLITKDRLLKNLSSFNKLVYQFGNHFVFGVCTLSLFLMFWILKMSRLEFGQQTEVLKTVGWPKQKVRAWILMESGSLLAVSLILSLIFGVIFYKSVLPHIKVGALLNQNFKL